jgi:hypothetical protein
VYVVVKIVDEKMNEKEAIENNCTRKANIKYVRDIIVIPRVDNIFYPCLFLRGPSCILCDLHYATI